MDELPENPQKESRHSTSGFWVFVGLCGSILLQMGYGLHNATARHHLQNCRHEVQQGLPDRRETDPKVGGILVLGQEAIAGRQLAGGDLGEDGPSDLIMEGRRTRSTDGQRRHRMRL